MSDTRDDSRSDADAVPAESLDSSDDRAFDTPLVDVAAPVSPEEAAAADAVEAQAEAEAERARNRLLREMKADDPEAESAMAPYQPKDSGSAEFTFTVGSAEGVMAPFRPKHGVERWPVKTVTDDDQDKINQTVEQTTIERLWLLKRPADMPLKKRAKKYQSRRAEGPETTIWQIEGRIIQHKWEEDGDFHIVVSSSATGRTIIVESPQDGLDVNDEPFVDPGSPFKEQIEAARRKFRKRLNPTPSFHGANVRARITGLGFFDIDHGQTGIAKTNAIELHPVIDVEFLD